MQFAGERPVFLTYSCWHRDLTTCRLGSVAHLIPAITSYAQSRQRSRRGKNDSKQTMSFICSSCCICDSTTTTDYGIISSQEDIHPIRFRPVSMHMILNSSWYVMLHHACDASDGAWKMSSYCNAKCKAPCYVYIFMHILVGNIQHQHDIIVFCGYIPCF